MKRALDENLLLCEQVRRSVLSLTGSISILNRLLVRVNREYVIRALPVSKERVDLRTLPSYLLCTTQLADFYCRLWK